MFSFMMHGALSFDLKFCALEISLFIYFFN